MKKTLLSLLASAMTLASATTANAEGMLYLGYCDGQIATTANGVTGSNAVVSEAIRIPGSALAAYVGCQISCINAGMTSSSAYPEQITGWVSATLGGDPLTSATLENPGKGWNEITLNNAYTITGEEEELWIGFDFTQPKKLSVISFVGESDPNGSYIGKNGKYTDYSSKGLGNLSIEAVVTGESLPVRDLTVTSFATVYEMTQIGSPIKVRVGVRNNASNEAVNPVIEYAINGQTVGSYTYPGTLAYRQMDVVSLEIPTDGITEECEVEVSAKISWGDGAADDAPADNVANLKTSMVENVFYRTMVAEEATGAWCGWCVRGLVALKHMRETYPDTFIGIGVHDGDEYAVTAYDSWIGNQPGMDGYPTALINRKGFYDPSPNNLELLMAAMPGVSPINIDATVQLSEDSTLLNVHTASKFLIANDAANYRVVYVVLEDKLPIKQHNYYAGGGNGPMGGFENMGSEVEIEIDDVARAVYPSPKGADDIIPQQIVAKEVYEHDIELVLPELADIKNAWLAVMLIDGNTGEIVQATKVASLVTENVVGIRNIASDHEAVRAYDIMGRQTTAKGIQLKGGQITFVR